MRKDANLFPDASLLTPRQNPPLRLGFFARANSQAEDHTSLSSPPLFGFQLPLCEEGVPLLRPPPPQYSAYPHTFFFPGLGDVLLDFFSVDFHVALPERRSSLLTLTLLLPFIFRRPVTSFLDAYIVKRTSPANPSHQSETPKTRHRFFPSSLAAFFKCFFFPNRC